MEEVRLRDIEKRLNTVENNQVLAQQSAEFAKEKVEDLYDKIKNIQAGVSRLVWAAGTMVLLAVGNWILQGGIKVGGI